MLCSLPVSPISPIAPRPATSPDTPAFTDDTRRDPPPRRPVIQRARQWICSPNGIVTSGAALAALILGLCAITLWAGRADAINRGRETSSNLITVVNRDIARNVEIYGLSLRAVVDGAQTPEVMALPPALRDKVLFDRATTAPFIGDVIITDETGRPAIIHGTETPPDNLAQRDFFTAQQHATHADLFISRPFRAAERTASSASIRSSIKSGILSDSKDDDWRVAMSRRIERPDGSFAGIAVLTIRLEYFERLLSHLDLGEQGSATLMQADGTLVARQPYDPRQIGRMLTPGPHNGALTRDTDGSFTGQSSVDGVSRLFTFAHVPNTSLIVTVGLSCDTLLNGWQHRSTLLGGAIIGLSAILMLAACWFAQALRASLAAQAQLEQLASIDGLTGLHNRRAFDEQLTREWKRSLRSGRPISLLMMDVDHFKAFNDRYGHGRGDLALISVADSIRDALRRPADLAARFGGEEFVVVLPDTDLDGARRVADTVRRAVMRQHIPHALSDHRALTVSIGASERRMLPDSDSIEALIKRADTALYAAKSEGRNTVAVFDTDGVVADCPSACEPFPPFDPIAGTALPC